MQQKCKAIFRTPVKNIEEKESHHIEKYGKYVTITIQ